MKWEIFTQEEQDIIERLTKSGDLLAITKAMSVDSPEKEYWLNKYIDERRPKVEVLDSKVRKEMLEAQRKGDVIDSPEKEIAWQKKLDEEIEKPKEKKSTPKSTTK